MLANVWGFSRAQAEPFSAQVEVLPSGREVLSCRVRGFYPFPAGVRAHGWLGWIFKDTHVACRVRSSSAPGRTVVMDFMTAGGQAHPV